MGELPKHIEYAIGIEKKLIDLRMKQIEGYQKRIKMMKDGKGFHDALKKHPPVRSNIAFNRNHYFELKGEKKKESKKEESQRVPLPEVSLSSLVFSLSSSALLHLGEIADPQTGEKKEDFGLAKHSIDTIGMLKEKTEGNLTEEEDKFLESILTDLRWRYVKATK